MTDETKPAADPMTRPAIEGLETWDGTQRGAGAVAARGDCVISVARDRGFVPGSLQAIQSKAMRDARPNGATLLPGDQLVVQPRERWEQVAIDAKHVFRRHVVKWKIAVIVRYRGRPRANAPCELAYDDTVLTGLKTDDAGLFTMDVPGHLRHARLTVLPEEQGSGVVVPRQELSLFAGALPPKATRQGLRARLANLGRAPSAFSDDRWTGAALDEVLLVGDQKAIDALMERVREKSASGPEQNPTDMGRVAKALGGSEVA
jgi:hypothetical protein